MLARLEDSLALLTSGPRDRPSRQQTLRGAIDWSYGLLSAGEARLFARLAVFAGGCTLEAAEAVCDAQLDELETLIANSLVRLEEPPGRDARFTMLETIREYASERLAESSERVKLQRRHADQLLAWAEERFERRRQGKLYGSWLQETDEYENVRAALGWARDAGELELELRLAAAMGLYWGAGGYLSEGRRWLEDVLRRAADADPALRAAALRAVAHLCWHQNDAAATREFGGAARALFEQLGDRREMGWSLMALAIAANMEGDSATGTRLYDELETIFRDVGEEVGLAHILNNRGYAAVVTGDYERAEAILLEAEDMQRRHGGAYWFTLLNLGFVWYALGRLDDAAAGFREAGEIGLRAGESETAYYVLEGFALLCAAREHDLVAAKLWGAAESVGEATGYSLQSAEREFHERAVPPARERAGTDAFDRAWAEGRTLTREQAFALALDLEQ
jgi:tetratricopeptide (TPR) repeat protein